jgi:hypothetical protein
MSESPFKAIEDPKKAEIDKRRTRVAAINPHAFMSLFTKGLRFRKQTALIEGIPEDALLVGITYDVRRDMILIVIESEEYDEIPINEIPPFQHINFQTQWGSTKKKVIPKRKKK